MPTAIYSFLSERVNDPKHSNILVREGKELVLKNKKKVGRFTLFQAKCGFGKASLHQVSKFVAKNHEQFFPSIEDAGTQARFNRCLKSYNNSRIWWKKAILSTPLVIDLNPLSPLKTESIDYRAEALVIKLNEQWKASTPEELIQTINELSAAISFLDPVDKKQNKALLNETIRLKKEIKATWIRVDVSPIKSTTLKDELNQSLKNLQTMALKLHFKKKLDYLDYKLTRLENRYEALECESDFLEQQLQRWRKDLNKGKPISFHKWKHCTPSMEGACSISTSSVRYAHQKAYGGAFVSCKAERGYGPWGVAMDESIEKTATQKGSKKYGILPKHNGIFSDAIYYGRVDDEEASSRFNLQVSLGLANNEAQLGFQKSSGIKIKQKTNPAQPLADYKNTTLSCIFYSTSDEASPEIALSGEASPEIALLKEFGIKHKISVISVEELSYLETLINSTFPLTLPKEWEGKIKHC